MASSMPFCTAGMYSLAGSHPPTMALTNSKPAPRPRGSALILTWPYWPRPPVWRTNLPSASYRTGNGLTVGHLGLAHVGIHLELALEAVHDDLQVQLAHARDDGLTGLRIGGDPEGGVLLTQAGQGHALSLSWSALVLGSMARSMTGSGISMDSRITRLAHPSPTRVSPVMVSLRPTTAPRSPALQLLHLLAVVGVHAAGGGPPAPCGPWWCCST
jgi:hypothetical protein